MIFKNPKSLGLSALFVTLGLGLTAKSAQAQVSFEQYLGSSGKSLSFMVDFAATTTVAGHKTYSTFTQPLNLNVVKYFDITTAAGTGQNACIEYAAFSNGVAADPVIWIKDNNQVYQKLSDDPPGSVFPKTRIWFTNVTSFRFTNPRIRVSAWSTAHNTDSFMFLSSLTTATTEAACTGDVNIAGATINGDGNVWIARKL
jgi:hypothetical protein